MYYGKITLVALCLCTTLLPLDARADNTPGSLVTISNGGTNVRNLFTISGNTITINGDESGLSQWSLSGAVSGRLLGISKLFLVDVSTSTPKPGPNVSTTANAGYVKTNAAAPFSPHTNWTDDTSNSYSRFVDKTNGGFSAQDPWLTVGDPILAGKNGTAKNEFGSFTFVTSLLDTNGKLKYDIGIDYLIELGYMSTASPTGRAYFAPTFDRPVAPVPELSTMLGFGGFVTLGGLAAFRQRRQSRKAA